LFVFVGDMQILGDGLKKRLERKKRAEMRDVIRFFFGVIIFGLGGRIITERHSSND